MTEKEKIYVNHLEDTNNKLLDEVNVLKNENQALKEKLDKCSNNQWYIDLEKFELDKQVEKNIKGKFALEIYRWIMDSWEYLHRDPKYWNTNGECPQLKRDLLDLSKIEYKQGDAQKKKMEEMMNNWALKVYYEKEE